MSGHNRGPGPQPHHTGHPAIRAAAAAIILLALAACGSTATTPATPAAATAIPSGGPGILTGAGSTYVAPFFAPAFARYHQLHPAVTVNYSPVGSSAGIAAISARQVDFGASDVPMNASELAAATGGPSHPGARRAGRRRRGLQPGPPGGRPAAPDRPGPRRTSSSARSPAGTTRPSPPSTPASPSRPRRSKSCTAPTAAAPPTSSATTCPASHRPGHPRSAPARRSTGRPGKAPKATAA